MAPTRLLLVLCLCLVLTACQKTTQFTYDAAADHFAEAARTMEDLVIDYDPPVERMVVIALVMNEGTGYLQEHQLYDFSNINLGVQPGSRIMISVPADPATTARWSLVRNETRTSSQPFVPRVMREPEAGVVYDRMNFLLEPAMDTSVTFVREDDQGGDRFTFRVNLTGLGEGSPQVAGNPWCRMSAGNLLFHQPDWSSEKGEVEWMSSRLN